jgi:hypothetical protein
LHILTFPISWQQWGVFLSGYPKRFRGGLGMLSTPLCVVAFGPKAVGILLRFFALGMCSVCIFTGRNGSEEFLASISGILVGVVIGVQLFGRLRVPLEFSDRFSGFDFCRLSDCAQVYC